jgi:hypothetical protein
MTTTQPDPATTYADDMGELYEAVKNLVDLYLNRVPAKELDREQLADCITEGLSDELARLYDIERQHDALAKAATDGGFVDLTDALAHASNGQVGQFGGAQ